MNEVLKVLVHDLGFKPVGDYYEAYASGRAIEFERDAASDWSTLIHNVSLRKSCGEWLIDSQLFDIPDGTRSYPLTIPEIKAFMNFIEEFEKGVRHD